MSGEQSMCRAGGTGPATPVLAGPIFQAPAIHFKLKPKQVFRVKKLVGRRWGAPNSNYLLVTVSTFVMPFSMDPLSPRMTPGCIMQK